MQMHRHWPAVLVRKRFVALIDDGFAVPVTERSIAFAGQRSAYEFHGRRTARYPAAVLQFIILTNW